MTKLRAASTGRKKGSKTALAPVDPAVSARMKIVRRTGTDPELRVRRLVTALGRRYRIEPRGLPGRPDLANVSAGWALFVHGCFWHAHKGCDLATVPKRNREWWMNKLEGNTRRDARKEEALTTLGLRVLVVWQCELRDPPKLSRRLARFLRVGGR